MKKFFFFLVLFCGLWGAFQHLSIVRERAMDAERSQARQQARRIQERQDRQRRQARDRLAQRNPRQVILPNGAPATSTPETSETPPAEASPTPPPPPPSVEVAPIDRGDEPVATAPAKPETPELVISEIMYFAEPPNSLVEDPKREFIELFNASSRPMDLEGYRFTKGVQFTFGKVTLPAGERLVVVPDKDAFVATHPDATSAIIVGPWQGGLSNAGERIRLEDKDGKIVSEVTYADQGDWAQRRHSRQAMDTRRNRGMFGGIFGWGNDTNLPKFGWAWGSEADGHGKSMELVNVKLPTDRGQNWAASKVDGGTPGKPNSAASEDAAPLIGKVRHHPAVPTPGQKAIVTAKVEDEDPASVKAHLLWRVSDRPDAPYQKVPMHHRGGGMYAAAIPPQGDKTVIEFYVEASDSKNGRTWPATTTQGQKANCQLQFDSETNEPGKAMYRLIFTAEDYRSFLRGATYANDLVNVTCILDDGSGPVIRYLCGARPRGANSRNYRPMPIRVNLPHDDPWRGAVRMNLNSYFPWLQVLGMRLFETSGFRAPEAVPVKLLVQGKAHARGGHMDFGYIAHLQPLDGDFLDQRFPEDSGGNLYKKVRPDNDWAYHNGQYEAYRREGWSKQTNANADDWSDLDNFLRVMNQEVRDSDKVAKVMDIDYWTRWLSVMALLANGEGSIAVGVDDDYAMYRGQKDQRFYILPHDLDTICGLGDESSIDDPRHTLFDFAESGQQLSPLAELFQSEEVRRRYFTQMRDLLETSFSEREFNAVVDDALGGWVPDDVREQMKSFMSQRRDYAWSEISQELGERSRERPAPTSLSSVSKPLGKVALNEIVAVGEDAIELHNPGSAAVALGGMSLSDDPAEPAKFVFPDGVEIASGGYLVIHADDQAKEGELHAGFSLETDGETLTLYDRAEGDQPRAVVDSVSFGPQIAGHSIGRSPSEPTKWTLAKPTLGTANELISAEGPTGVKINEWLALPAARYEFDFVELFNPSDSVVALGGLRLTDDAVNYPKRFVFPELSFLGPRGYVVLQAQGKRQPGPTRFSFKLASHYGFLTLAGENGAPIDRQHYQCLGPDASKGRLPDGKGSFGFLPLPTPGAANGESGNGARSSTLRDLLDGLRVTEIMFHPPGGKQTDFIEVANVGSKPLSLKGARFTEGVQFEFDDLSLAPGEAAVVVGNQRDFIAQYGSELKIAGQYSGKLSKKGEFLSLQLPKPETLAIQRFKFNDKWFPLADGGGRSLRILHPDAPVQAWSESFSWSVSKEDGGTPGRL